MANWYDKYLSIYGKPFSEVSSDIIEGTRLRLAALNQPCFQIQFYIVLKHSFTSFRNQLMT